jgi:flagellar biosynthesis protein FlhF
MSSIRTFRAASVPDALALVRRELGPEALILGQREVRRRRFPWQRVTIETELTAGLGRHRAGEERGTRGEIPESCVPSPEQGSGGDAAFRPHHSPLTTHHSPTDQPVPSDSVDPFRLYTRLIEQDLDEEDAREIIAELRRGAGRNPAALADILRDMLPCRGAIRVTPGQRRVVALVGATGVGKTTTIAKLAAHFRLHEQRRVGLITVDTYRVAAIDQLRTYAELIDVPMRVVNSPREMQQAMDDLAASDLVLIDTAGRSPQDELKIQELRGFLQAARADEVHLVLSLTSGRRNLALTAEKFQRVGPTAVLLTKLDEAPGAGAALSAARRAALPVSYVTTGQDVPDDIEAADAGRLAQLILGEDTLEFPDRSASLDRGAVMEVRRFPVSLPSRPLPTGEQRSFEADSSLIVSTPGSRRHPDGGASCAIPIKINTPAGR